MVDSQFQDDKYVDNAERNREAIKEADRRAAERAALMPPKKTASQKMSERSLKIQAAAMKAVDSKGIELTEFSKFVPDEDPIVIQCKRLAPQELLAGDLLPVGARKMVSHFVNIGMKATASERARIGLHDIDAANVIDDVFDGDTMAGSEAYIGMIDAICIAAVRDPDIRLYWDEKAKGDDVNGLVVSVIPFKDREAIASWALKAEEVAASTVEPFLQREANTVRPVSAVERWDGEAKRSDQV